MAYIQHHNVYKTITMEFDHTRVTALGKPTNVTLGAHNGFSLPVYDSDDEELFACKSMPLEMDDTENISIFLGGYLDTANNAKKFKLQVSWAIDDLSSGTALSSSVTDVEVETTTGDDAQYTPFKIEFAIASVASGCGAGCKVGIRIGRIDASENEIAGEVVICGAAIRFVAKSEGTPV